MNKKPKAIRKQPRTNGKSKRTASRENKLRARSRAEGAKAMVAIGHPTLVAEKPAALRILQTPGTPWVVIVDGDDLVASNIHATCFGGKFDSGDDGKTESGVDNSGYPTAGAYPMGVALPIRSTEAATRNSPLAFKGPHIPWLTPVKVWREAEGEQSAVSCILIDNGPDVRDYPSHAVDLNPNAALHFAPNYDPKKIADYWGEDGFSYRIVGGAKFIS